MVFSFQKYFNVWVFKSPGDYDSYYTWINSGWFLMEMATIITAVLFILIFKFPFLTFPLSFTVWFLSMDITPVVYGSGVHSWEERKMVSAMFGALVLVIAFIVDRKTKGDFSLWLYIFGLMAFWTGITFMDSDSELNKLLYCLVNLFLIIVSVLLQRKVFIVFGSMGLYVYLYHVSSRVFEDSLLFPVALSMLGLSIIVLGIVYSKNHVRFEKAVLKRTPATLLKLLPPFKGLS
ncbi:MAG: hypothetical protein JXA71_00700 [Chitinispirillaceae bacterium]|nr:hypothetical protein [Chitinispirillaceae bacterium]